MIKRSNPTGLCLLVFWLTLLVAGCDLTKSEFSKKLDNYEYRLRNTLDLTLTEESGSLDESRLKYPSRRTLQANVEVSKINLIDFLKLSNCRVHQLISERNSILGKVQAASQTLLYEVRFIQLGKACLSALSTNDTRSNNSTFSEQHDQKDIRRILRQAVTRKQNDLFHRFWNTTYASEEFQYAFSIGTTPPSYAELNAKPTQLLDALTFLYAFARHTHETATDSKAPHIETSIVYDENISAELEAALFTIQKSKYAGKLLRGMHRATHSLNRLTEAVQNKQSTHPVCPFDRPSPRSRIMHTVFIKFYIGEVQPLLSLLDRRVNELSDQHNALIQYIPENSVSSKFVSYWQKNWSISNAQSLRQQFNQAIGAHTKMWQELLASCDLSPDK